MAKNKVKMNICSTNYTIVSDDNVDYISMVGKEVNNEMTATLEKNDNTSVTTAAVLAALKYCDKLKKAEQCSDNLRAQIKEYIEESSEARTKAEKLVSEVERLKKQINSLKEKNNKVETKPKQKENNKKDCNLKEKIENFPEKMFSSEELLREERDENISFFK